MIRAACLALLLAGCATHPAREFRHEVGTPIGTALISSGGTVIEINNHVVEWLWQQVFGPPAAKP